MQNVEKTKNYAITFAEMFQFRRVWMLLGVAWTVLFHSPIAPPGLLYAFKDIGYGGVDILLFASGIGCFFSLRKNRNAKEFLKRRLASIFPMWAVFLVIFCCVESYKGPMTVPQILGNVFGLGLFADMAKQFNWYIAAMWVCYALAPTLYDLVCDAKTRNKALLVGLVFLFSPVFWGKWMLVFWSRLPVFIMGMGFAEASTKRQGITWKEILAALAVMVVGLGILGGCYLYLEEDWLWSYGLWWHPFILITPGLVMVISLVSRFLYGTRLRRVIQWLDKMGNHTFSLFLSNMLILENIDPLYDNGYMANNLFTYALVLLAIAAFAAVLHYLTLLVKKVLLRR